MRHVEVFIEANRNKPIIIHLNEKISVDIALSLIEKAYAKLNINSPARKALLVIEPKVQNKSTIRVKNLNNLLQSDSPDDAFLREKIKRLTDAKVRRYSRYDHTEISLIENWNQNCELSVLLIPYEPCFKYISTKGSNWIDLETSITKYPKLAYFPYANLFYLNNLYLQSSSINSNKFDEILDFCYHTAYQINFLSNDRNVHYDDISVINLAKLYRSNHFLPVHSRFSTDDKNNLEFLSTFSGSELNFQIIMNSFLGYEIFKLFETDFYIERRNLDFLQRCANMNMKLKNFRGFGFSLAYIEPEDIRIVSLIHDLLDPNENWFLPFARIDRIEDLIAGVTLFQNLFSTKDLVSFLILINRRNNGNYLAIEQNYELFNINDETVRHYGLFNNSFSVEHVPQFLQEIESKIIIDSMFTSYPEETLFYLKNEILNRPRDILYDYYRDKYGPEALSILISSQIVIFEELPRLNTRNIALLRQIRPIVVTRQMLFNTMFTVEHSETCRYLINDRTISRDMLLDKLNYINSQSILLNPEFSILTE